MQANAILPQADILEKSNLIFFDFFFMAGKKIQVRQERWRNAVLG